MLSVVRRNDYSINLKFNPTPRFLPVYVIIPVYIGGDTLRSAWNPFWNLITLFRDLKYL